ncbi:MAG: Hpt domain-containing protein, partial [Epsilonproteobacteria bacterium]|nr:Hpt domain-containing protein [Campylobacterota bacterium]
MDEFQEILQDFLVESFELIEQLDQDLVELESNPEDLELLNGIFRVAHTVKGASSFLNFDVLTHLTHHMEDVLNKARHGELIISPDIMDVILESVDLMKMLLSNIRDTSSDAGIDVSACVARLDRVSGGDGHVETPKASAPVMEPEESFEEELIFEEEPQASSTQGAQEEPDYDSMSADEIEAEIERLLAQRQAEDKAKREAKMGSATPPPPPARPARKKDDDDDDDERGDARAAAPTKKAPATVEQTIRVDVNRL